MTGLYRMCSLTMYRMCFTVSRCTPVKRVRDTARVDVLFGSLLLSHLFLPVAESSASLPRVRLF